MAQVRVDLTKEEEVLKLVPYMTKYPNGLSYHAEVKNYSGEVWESWAPSFLFELWPAMIGGERPIEDKWRAMALPTRVAYVLGWRHLSFRAFISITNGIVSRMEYEIEPDVFVGWPVSEFVTARTVHGYLRARGRPIEVGSIGEESPNFRFGAIASQYTWFAGADSSIAVAYTPSAPPDVAVHAFQVDLSCFWGIQGCDSVRQVVPALWQDREALPERTRARFASANPCSDEVLAGRVRTLPDLTVTLLEVVRSQVVEINREGDRSTEIATDYRLKENIWGKQQGPWTAILHRSTIPWMPWPAGLIANPVRPDLRQTGQRFLFFGGATFDSCRIVPATPSAEAAVRQAARPSRRVDDYLIEGRQ